MTEQEQETYHGKTQSNLFTTVTMGTEEVQVVERGSSIIKAILNKIFREKCWQNETSSGQ